MNVQVIDLSTPLWLQTLQKLRHNFYHLPKYVALELRRVKATPETILIVDGEKVFLCLIPILQEQATDDRTD